VTGLSLFSEQQNNSLASAERGKLYHLMLLFAGVSTTIDLATGKPFWHRVNIDHNY